MRINNKRYKVLENKIKAFSKRTKFSKNNFFIQTQGVFNPISKQTFDNLECELIFESYSGSKYWTGIDKGGEYLVRFSNHWGDDIRTCSWFLSKQQLKQKMSCAGYSQKYGFDGVFGKIYYDQFVLNQWIYLRDFRIYMESYKGKIDQFDQVSKNYLIDLRKKIRKQLKYA